MRSVYEGTRENAREIECRLRQGHDEIVSRTNFKAVCQLAYGEFKTAEKLAADCRRDARVVARWFSGEHEPPASVVVFVFQKLFPMRG